MRFAQRLACRRRRLARELDDVVRRARVAARTRRNERNELVRDVRSELGGAAADDRLELAERQRLELVHLRPGEERRVDLEVRVLGRRADQGDDAFLDAGQQRVLLRLVEAVDLVEEEDRPLPVRSEPLARPREDAAHVGDTRRHGREILEGGAGRPGDDAGKGRLATPRRPHHEHEGAAWQPAAEHPVQVRHPRRIAQSGGGACGCLPLLHKGLASRLAHSTCPFSSLVSHGRPRPSS